MGKLKDKLVASGIPNINWIWTAVSQEEQFRHFLDKAKPKKILEIGTFNGVSTALLSEYADIVYTVDICEQPWITNAVWKHCGCKDKVKSFIVKSTPKKRKLIESLDFDFAFIDGGHLEESILVDFDLAKRCGKMLFHDYWKRDDDWDDVRHFIDGLDGYNKEILEPFAYVSK